MTKRIAITLLTSIAAVSAIDVSCTSSVPTISTGDVVQLSLCAIDANGNPQGCDQPQGIKAAADGTSPVAVHVWTPIASDGGERQDPFSVEIATSTGSFLTTGSNNGKNDITVDIARSGGAWLELVPGTSVGRFAVTATAFGFQAVQTLSLEPAPLGPVEVLPSPVFVGTGSASISLQITVRGVGGASPSSGTYVSLSPSDITPSGTVDVYPPTALLDSNFHATATVAVSSQVQSATLTVTANGPPPLSGLGDGGVITSTAVIAINRGP